MSESMPTCVKRASIQARDKYSRVHEFVLFCVHCDYVKDVIQGEVR